ncbi:Carcinoembryonic antigen-related cell adhesion molecule 21 [Galemys pyrenaicus]|uniref:Carcinoembryonic antigen-related cell adhesion molecule 21 n=1 Tax=Galemys pyrenaicus TaxID=202257 RepID=A0A8J5ZUK7_GALPY|nr:Carcinoembryonic antigen-related cell adhesion molecule 21 [Galemys pyrenaicus]
MAQTLTWIKDDMTNPSNQIGTYTKSTRRFTFGPASQGRKFITPKGTLVIMNASREDTGNYTLAVTRTGNSVLYASVHLVVLGRRVPTSRLTLRLPPACFSTEPVTSNTAQEQKYTVQKNEKVAIKCVVREFGYSAYWFFQNQRLQLKDRMKLSNERLGLNIKGVKEEDAGKYYCKFIKRLSTKRTETLTLEVV